MGQFKPQRKSPKAPRHIQRNPKQHPSPQEDELPNAKQRDMSPDNILAMQQTFGNQYVMRQMQDNGTIQRNVFANQVFGSRGERNDNTDVSWTTGFDEVESREDVQINSTDNVTLKGSWYEPSANWTQNGDAVGKTLLFLSGSGGSAEKYGTNVAYQYVKRGANALVANYRGFGGSKQTVTDKKGRTKEKNIDPTQQGVYEDARAMFDWLGANKGVQSTNVIVHGYSLGGAVAANLVAQLAEAGINISALVMHSAMPSTKEPAKDASEDMLSVLPKKWARKIGKWAAEQSGTDFTTDDKFQRLAQISPNLPILFISGSYGDGDHLSDTHTGLSGRATGKGLTNVSTIDSTGDHFSNSSHITNNATEFNQFLESLNPQQIEQVNEVVEEM